MFALMLLGSKSVAMGTAETVAARETACGRSDDVPCLEIPPCDAAREPAPFSIRRVSNAAGSEAARQLTKGHACWNESSGLHIFETASDTSVFSPYTTCNSPVFANSDVLEVFVAPALQPTDNPRWYYEIDASPSGVLWAALTNNTRGNASTCVASMGCSCTHGKGEKCSAKLPCTGRATFDDGPSVRMTNETGAYSSHLTIPWSLFALGFRPERRSGKPWPWWRINFYRYDYPEGPGGRYELTAWSPTHEPSFHVPSRFGVARLVE